VKCSKAFAALPLFEQLSFPAIRREIKKKMVTKTEMARKMVMERGETEIAEGMEIKR
jgi:hypothetical protein